MKNLAFEIIGASEMISLVRLKYLETRDRLELNKDRALHDRILYIYNAEVPHIANEISRRLKFSNWILYNNPSFAVYKSKLTNPEDANLFQEAYRKCECRSEIETLINLLSETVWEAVM
ncbi:MAG: hypothetical protein JKY70_10735 [Mucilaginibacter sp.]|nr:hypothetical protein [Mucilaginibacter sp.]